LFLTQKIFFNHKKIGNQHRKNKTRQVKLCYTIKSMNVFLKEELLPMGEKETFYITTPIYYPCGKLHIGNSYTTIACNDIARFRRLMGFDVFYLPGADGNVEKIEQKS